MSETARNILVIIGMLLVGGLGWYMYDQSRSLELQMTGGPGVNIQAETQQFIQQQQQLQVLSVTSTLFDDSDFQDLHSIAAPVPTFDTGRSNPFTPSF